LLGLSGFANTTALPLVTPKGLVTLVMVNYRCPTFYSILLSFMFESS
jgi:hypothetical protein